MIIFGEFEVKKDGSVEAEFILRGIETPLETAIREAAAQGLFQPGASPEFQKTRDQLRRAVKARAARKVHGLEGGDKC